MPRFIVSACLAGHPCRYDGKACSCPEVVELVKRGDALPVCPEMLGGLGVPRPCSEQFEGRVRTRNGEDVTDAFTRGARKALQQALDAGCTAAILKEKSPSCGVHRIYDGTFSGRIVAGKGIWTTLLIEHSLEIFTEEALPPSSSCQTA